jgi:hypothetical protein
VNAWLTALEARHLSDLRIPEVTRALRALSSAYVERRQKVAAGATMDSAGKRAAFALFYAPLHFLTVRLVLAELGARPLRRIVDLGCGTGVAGAAWATWIDRPLAAVTAIDRHPWALDEARWTYGQFGITAAVKRGTLDKLPVTDGRSGVIAGWVLNEMPADSREALESSLIRAGRNGASVLILEPLSRAIAPWWDTTASLVCAAGGRADEWRFPIDLPPLQRLLDRAAGLRHQELTVRTLSMNVGG